MHKKVINTREVSKMLSTGVDEVEVLTDPGKIMRGDFAEGSSNIPANEIGRY